MSNTLRFEIDTDASYTPAEIEELQEAWVGWMTDVDPDADADTADVKIVQPSNGSIDADAVANFIKQGGEVEYQVQIRLKDSEGVTGSAVGSVGNLS
jgi:hypothetical protein